MPPSAPAKAAVRLGNTRSPGALRPAGAPSRRQQPRAVVHDIVSTRGMSAPQRSRGFRQKGSRAGTTARRLRQQEEHPVVAPRNASTPVRRRGVRREYTAVIDRQLLQGSAGAAVADGVGDQAGISDKRVGAAAQRGGPRVLAQPARAGRISLRTIPPWACPPRPVQRHRLSTTVGSTPSARHDEHVVIANEPKRDDHAAGVEKVTRSSPGSVAPARREEMPRGPVSVIRADKRQGSRRSNRWSEGAHQACTPLHRSIGRCSERTGDGSQRC